MVQSLTAVFDGEALRLDDPVDLEVNERYQVMIGDRIPESAGPDALDLLEAMKGSVRMPEDWSAETDHYLYGTPKRAQETAE